MHLKPDKDIEDLSRMFNPVLRGWINYYGRFYKSQLYPGATPYESRHSFIWARRKYKKAERHQKTGREHWLGRIARREPNCSLIGRWEFCQRLDNGIIVTGSSKELLEHEVKPVVIRFLKERGLTLSEEKTKVTHIEEGFDFLGQNVRKYNGKLLIKPSKKNVKNFLEKVRKVLKKHKTAKQENVIRTLNPIIRGWANYHRHRCGQRNLQLGRLSNLAEVVAMV